MEVSLHSIRIHLALIVLATGVCGYFRVGKRSVGSVSTGRDIDVKSIILESVFNGDRPLAILLKNKLNSRNNRMMLRRREDEIRRYNGKRSFEKEMGEKKITPRQGRMYRMLVTPPRSYDNMNINDDRFLDRRQMLVDVSGAPVSFSNLPYNPIRSVNDPYGDSGLHRSDVINQKLQLLQLQQGKTPGQQQQQQLKLMLETMFNEEGLKYHQEKQQPNLFRKQHGSIGPFLQLVSLPKQPVNGEPIKDFPMFVMEDYGRKKKNNLLYYVFNKRTVMVKTSEEDTTSNSDL